MADKQLWGIDLGGTKLEGVILKSLEDPQPLVRIRINTEAANGYEHILNRVAELITLMKAESGLQPPGIGFGTPGVLDPLLQTMKNCNTTCLNGEPLKKDLEEKLRVPVMLANDANCFALAETQWGAVKRNALPARLAFGIILGTGVGGGIVFDGKIWGGHHGIAGEWGHNFLDESGGRCYCGRTGCVETIISGPALEKYYHGLCGHSLKLKEIVSRHLHASDLDATKTIERLCHFFGKGIAAVINVLDPDVIVVGGGVGNIDAIYNDGISSLKQFIFNNRVDVSIVKPILGDSAGVFGAAALMN